MGKLVELCSLRKGSRFVIPNSDDTYIFIGVSPYNVLEIKAVDLTTNLTVYLPRYLKVQCL